MDLARVGNHQLTSCPCCDKLFEVIVTGDNEGSSVDRLSEMLRQHWSESPACDAYMSSIPSVDELIDSLHPKFEAARAERKQRLEHNPHNGTLGYWLVSGVRNEARTRASSAMEAIEKCRDVVQSWESPEAEFN